MEVLCWGEEGGCLPAPVLTGALLHFKRARCPPWALPLSAPGAGALAGAAASPAASSRFHLGVTVAHRAWSPHVVVSWRKHWKVNLRFSITSLGPSRASRGALGLEGSRAGGSRTGGRAALVCLPLAAPGLSAARAPVQRASGPCSCRAVAGQCHGRVSAFAPGQHVREQRAAGPHGACAQAWPLLRGAGRWDGAWCPDRRLEPRPVTCIRATGRHGLKRPTRGCDPHSC